jgi:hypothetical protein
MDQHLARYVFNYYSQFMTEKEKLANQHLFGTAKAMHGRTDLAAQEEAKNSPHAFGSSFRTILK